MPKASPTHVIVHRLELQKGLNQELVQYLDAQQKQAQFQTLVKAGVAGAGLYAGWVAVTFAGSLWAKTSMSLGGLVDDAQAVVEDVITSYVTGPDEIPISDISGKPWPYNTPEPTISNPAHGIPVIGPLTGYVMKKTKAADREPWESKVARWWVNL